MAIAANVPGRRADPRAGRSSSSASPRPRRRPSGPGKIANFETLGYVDLRGSDYFRQGTHMHLSHVTEDLEAWYVNFDFDERVTTAFRPGLDVRREHADGRRRGRSRPRQPRDVRRAVPARAAGSATAPRSRRPRASPQDVVGADGTRYPKGSGDPDPRRLQHARQPVLLLRPAERAPGAGRRPGSTCRLQPLERRLPPQPARDGRRAPGRRRCRSSRATARQGFNSILTHDAPPELPRPAAAPPQLPARRALATEAEL